VTREEDNRRRGTHIGVSGDKGVGVGNTHHEEYGKKEELGRECGRH
jgi:hypothetical protein